MNYNNIMISNTNWTKLITWVTWYGSCTIENLFIWIYIVDIVRNVVRFLPYHKYKCHDGLVNCLLRISVTMDRLFSFIGHVKVFLKSFTGSRSLLGNSDFVNGSLKWLFIYRFLGFIPIYKKCKNEICMSWPNNHLVLGVITIFAYGFAWVRCYKELFYTTADYETVAANHTDPIQYILWSTNFYTPFVCLIVWIVVLYTKKETIFYIFERWVNFERIIESKENYKYISYPLIALVIIGLMNSVNEYGTSETSTSGKLETVFLWNLQEIVQIILLLLTEWMNYNGQMTVIYLLFSLGKLLGSFNNDLVEFFASEQSASKVREKRQISMGLWHLIQAFNSSVGILTGTCIAMTTIDIFTVAYNPKLEKMSSHLMIVGPTIAFDFICIMATCESGERISFEVYFKTD